MDAYATLLGKTSELMTGAAVPTVIGFACGFTVSRPPIEPADAERLAAEHVAIAGLTAGTSIRAYARALIQPAQSRRRERVTTA